VPDKFRELREALRIRNTTREQIRSLNDQRNKSGGDDAKFLSQYEKLISRLASVDDRLSGLRQALAEEIEESRTTLTAAEEGMRAQRSREVTDTAYDEEGLALHRQLESERARLSLLEAAATAESAADIDRISAMAVTDTDGTAAEKKDAIMESYNNVRFADWPGASVPERIGMLWREGRKPQSKRSILISAAAIVALTLIVVGGAFASGTSGERDVTDFLRDGELLVPVLVDGADGVRNLEFTIEYDSDLLTGISAVQGDVGRLAVMQYDIDRSGILTVTVRDVVGISGTGPIVVVRFRANDRVAEQAPLMFTFIKATDVRTMSDMPVLGDDGWIDTETLDMLAPELRFTPH